MRFTRKVQAVAMLDEDPADNYLRKHYLDDMRQQLLQALPDNTAEPALLRIFGAKPGSYGAGILPLINEQNWQTDADFATAYLNWGGYAYGRQVQGADARDALRHRLSGVEVALHNQDNREHDIFDSDDYLQYHGGMIATICSLTGRQPRATRRRWISRRTSYAASTSKSGCAALIEPGQNVIIDSGTTCFHVAKRLDDKVDRTEWGMTPQTVNAYYNPSFNEIVFPAAILQPPFFDPNADDAVNYGGIGAVIGHEISHAFDDQGSKYDARGILQNWWTASDRANFDKRTTALSGQYDAYSPLEGMHVNGKLTLGEEPGFGYEVDWKMIERYKV